MIQSKIKTAIKTSGLSWLTAPTAGHVVAYYSGDNQLLDTLEEYIGGGLAAGTTCIVIATALHLQLLQARLNLTNEQAKRLIIFDAAQTLKSFMVNGRPDQRLFTEVVGGLMASAAKNGTPIRAFGEMVALLWKSGNREATIMLEIMWKFL